MKIIKTIWILLLFVLPWGCSNHEEWGEVTIDPKISNDSVYKRMDTEEEIFSTFEKDRTRKKSTDVQYLIGNENADKYSKMNNCRAYFNKSDTLIVDIGISSGFVSSGFIIKYKGNKFFTEPYYDDDIVFEGEPFETYKLVYQKLNLNKTNYKAGDSLFGKIEFKSIETDLEKKKHEHTGNGFFRAKVKSSPFE